MPSKGLSRVFSSTTVQKHQFFSALPSLRSNSHISHDYWKNHHFDYTDVSKVISLLFNTPSSFFFCHSLSFMEQTSFNFVAAVTIHSDSGAQENKIWPCFCFFPSICHELIGPDTMNLVYECQVSSQNFHSPLLHSSRGPSVPLHFLPLG